MKSEAAHRQIFKLSKRLRVEMIVGTGGFVCEWIPSPPNRMTRKELRAYRAARDEMLNRLNVRALVVETPRAVIFK